MLGRRTRQVSMADLDGWYEKIPDKSVWSVMRKWSETHLSDEAFADWYAKAGRPSIPPSYVVTMILLQIRMGWSDEEAVEAGQFDDRVKFALSVSRSPEITMERSTLCKYRSRFLQEGMGRELLAHSLNIAADAGLLGNDEDLVDSFMIAGAAARQSTHVLIYRAIGRVLAEAQDEGLELPPLRRRDYGGRKKPVIAWKDAAARQALLEDLVADGRDLQAHFHSRNIAESLRQALDLLQLVVEQDITEDSDGRVTIAQKTARDRVLSTVDPEMRHGRKSKSRKFDGYKGHILTQNAGPGEARPVTATVVTPANLADGAALPGLVAERQALTQEVPRQVMGDSAYGSLEVRDEVTEVSPTTAVEAPLPPGGPRPGRLGKDAFAIDTDAHTITCPAQHTVAYRPKAVRPGHRATQVVWFPKELCEACPLAPQCVGTVGRARTITLHAQEARMQAERARQNAPAWQEHYRKRSRVERDLRDLTRRSARQARGFGPARVSLQLQLAAAVRNLEELGRVLGAAWPAHLFRPTCQPNTV